MTTTSIILGFLAAVLQVLGYVLYWKGMKKDLVQSNTVSWATWSFGGLLNLATYVQMTNDLIKDLLPIACSIACIVIFVRMLVTKGLGKLDEADFMILVADIAITAVWFVAGATEANVMYQIGTIVSYVPMIRGIFNGRDKEIPTPWLVWTCAYITLAATVLVRFDKWQDLVYPAVNLALCLIVWVLAIVKRPRLTL